MKLVELKQKSEVELKKTLADNRERLRLLRFDLIAGKVKNVREVRRLKKEIARILTLLKLPTSEGGRGNPPVAPSRKTAPKGR